MHFGGSQRLGGEAAGGTVASGGDHKPARDDRRVGRGLGPAAPQRNRLVGHQDAGKTDNKIQ